MSQIQQLIPEILVAGLGVLLLGADLLLGPRRGRTMMHLTLLCLGAGLLAVGLCSTRLPYGEGSLWVFDPAGVLLKAAVLLASTLSLVLALGYSRVPSRHAGILCALLLWATSGLMILVSAVDWLLIFVALELVSIASFVLAGFERSNLKSTEGAIKYFLFGAFASGITLYGISLFYGATGTTHLLRAPGLGVPIYVLGLLLTLVGLGFKASLVPFHFWVPDAYQGAPTPVTAWLSVAPKIAVMALLLRLFTVLLPEAHAQLALLFAVVAGLTMTVGNLTAFFQTDVKRLLAYSSVAQAGYMLIGFVSGGELGRQGVLLYSLVYLFMNIGAFGVAIAVAESEKSYELEAFDGLAKRNFGLSLLMTFFMLSLAGIPPLAGFIGKFYIFASAMESGWYVLAVVGVLNTVASVYYYMLVVYRMFFNDAKTEAGLPVGWYVGSGIAVAAAGVLLLGVYPQPLIETVRYSAQFLP